MLNLWTSTRPPPPVRIAIFSNAAPTPIFSDCRPPGCSDFPTANSPPESPSKISQSTRDRGPLFPLLIVVGCRFDPQSSLLVTSYLFCPYHGAEVLAAKRLFFFFLRCRCRRGQRELRLSLLRLRPAILPPLQKEADSPGGFSSCTRAFRYPPLTVLFRQRVCSLDNRRTSSLTSGLVVGRGKLHDSLEAASFYNEVDPYSFQVIGILLLPPPPPQIVSLPQGIYCSSWFFLISFDLLDHLISPFSAAVF